VSKHVGKFLFEDQNENRLVLENLLETYGIVLTAVAQKRAQWWILLTLNL
jgi:CheY-like chemotaxis protein